MFRRKVASGITTKVMARNCGDNRSRVVEAIHLRVTGGEYAIRPAGSLDPLGIARRSVGSASSKRWLAKCAAYLIDRRTNTSARTRRSATSRCSIAMSGRPIRILIILLRVVTHVLERQHRNDGLSGTTSSSGGTLKGAAALVSVPSE